VLTPKPELLSFSQPAMPQVKSKISRTPLAKTPTGIDGLDEVTGGGLPEGRTTLVCGSPGCGKTLLAMEFLVHGAVQYGDPGVCMEFEEAPDKLTANVRSLGLDLRELGKRKKLLVDYVRVERNEIEETGEYNLEGLFIRLGHAVDVIKAKTCRTGQHRDTFCGII
jgi:circadian clock protein KaiC